MADFVPNVQSYGVVVNAFSPAANGLPRLSAGVWLVAAGWSCGRRRPAE